MPVSGKSNLPPCESCRRKHKQCDFNQPTCLRCRRTGENCVRKKYRIRFCYNFLERYSLNFARDQTWLPSSIDFSSEFVDETEAIRSHYSQKYDRENPIQESSPLPTAIYLRPSSESSCTNEANVTENDLTPFHHRQRLSPSPPPIDDVRNQRISFLAKPSQYYFSPLEACLMHYFVRQLSPWLDLYDTESHFATSVPQRARICPPLLNAIFATSAKHLTRVEKNRVGGQFKYDGKLVGNLRPETAIHYHNKCIEHLLSLSESPPEMENENLLAAAIILRFYEEVDAPSIAEDMESAVSGIRVFLSTQAMSASGSKLCRATYWVALRQEALTAFAKQRPFRLPLGPCLPFRSFEPAEDAVWTNRLVIYLADVLQFCFGVDELPSPAVLQTHYSATANTGIHTAGTFAERVACYEDLVAFDTYWEEHKPPSFEPIHARSPDSTRRVIFPEIWFVGSCHVIGIQHLELARILLTVYNPSILHLGLERHETLQSVDQKVKKAVLRLCGIATTNRDIPPALLTACIAIAICGDRFDDRLEQQALLGVLAELEEEHAWPTRVTQAQLKRAWGWEGASCIWTNPR